MSKLSNAEQHTHTYGTSNVRNKRQMQRVDLILVKTFIQRLGIRSMNTKEKKKKYRKIHLNFYKKKLESFSGVAESIPRVNNTTNRIQMNTQLQFS